MVKYYGIAHREESDNVLYDSDLFYVCIRENEKYYFLKTTFEVDEDVFEGLIEMETGNTPMGLMKLMDELLEKTWMYEDLNK